MKQTIFLLIIKLFFSQGVLCQELNYSYSNNEFDLETYFETITEKQLNKIESNYKKQRKRFYTKQLKSLKKRLSDSTFIFNDNLSTRIQNIFDEIYRANPELINNNFRFLIDKSLFPNAAAYGNGLFTINLGLFTLLDSEDEMAFVICHELAHQYLLHIKSKIDKYVSKVNSKELKAKTKEIKKMKYGRNSAGIELLKDLNFDFSEHSRASELEADEKGLDYFSKTKYNQNAAFTSLVKLGSLENIVFKHKVNWALIFNLKDYHFDEKLLESEESIFNSNTIINDYEWDKDSLKSHPNINVRIDKLNTGNLDLSDTIKKVEDKDYKKSKELSKKLSISTALDSGKLDLVIYLLAQNMENKKHDKPYYIGKISQVLKDIYILKKSHTIGHYVPYENNLSNEIYLNDIKRFIHNIDLYELKSLIKNFTSYHYGMLKDNDELTTVYKIFNNN